MRSLGTYALPNVGFQDTGRLELMGGRYIIRCDDPRDDFVIMQKLVG